jgi:release factor glutamine methyltransferase
MSSLTEPVIVTMLRTAGCVFAEDEARLLVEAAATPAHLATMVQRRVAGQPLEHILGWVEFCGLRIAVDPGVFVPRRRTEFLVEQAAARAGSAPVVVDMCCGSGAVGVALAAAIGPITLYGVDIEPAAVACARRNVAGIGGQVFAGDLFEPLPAILHGRVDILVANGPYVPTDAIAMMPPEARDFEPLVALDGGADGLDIFRRVATGAPRWLAPGGRLLIETSVRQAPAAVDAVERTGLRAQVARSAERGATVVIGQIRSHIL